MGADGGRHRHRRHHRPRAGALGDLVFIELPEVGRALDRDEACAVVESVKAASDVYAPLAGNVIEINTPVVEDPSLVSKRRRGRAAGSSSCDWPTRRASTR